ncbi:SIR2 family protein [Archangium gephyra]|uniref:SIR2 family protein n=1 Tax=Archangium gephyra TaxID=48 RepID=UPI003B80206B
MLSQEKKYSRKRILRRIADASLFGHLGMFVGTGFSMALTDGVAPNFEKLLRRAAEDLELEFDFDDPKAVRGLSYPQLATRLVAELTESKSNRAKAMRALKRKIASICNLMPDDLLRDQYVPVLAQLRPSWVITTNYDFILESLLERAVPLLPHEAVTPRRDYVPVYHLHGHRLVPESIVITEDDYVELLGPMEYRQNKLSLLLTESTTLMLGYSGGDINVRSAMKLARAYAEDRDLELQRYQGLVVQALYVTDRAPRSEPYRGLNAEVIIEISDILQFLEEVRDAKAARKAEFRKTRRIINKVLEDDDGAEKLVGDVALRKEFVKALRAFPRSYEAGRVVEFLRRALNPLWNRARQRGNWHYYNAFVDFLLDVLEGINLRKLHPILSEYLSESFSDIAWYLEPGKQPPSVKGKAWDATDTWRQRRSSLSSESVDELKRYARNNGNSAMALLLNEIET